MRLISQLWANKIIAGDKTYAGVPAQLKEEVKEDLTNKGHADLVKSRARKQS
jgi:hypothetical protein